MLPDCFSTLKLARAPWLAPDVVTGAFQSIAAKKHPDVSGGSASAFAELNTAWETLRSPASCLRHFLELEHPSALALAERTPPQLGELFMEIAAARQEAQSLAGKLSGKPPLARALIEPERIAARAKLDSLAAKTAARADAACSAIRASDATPEELAAQLATLVFLGKWAAQLRESALALA
jgi:hypothetical protein